ncbi:MAG: N-acetylmuramoyl-L-alanine amidase [Clostridia bacterium]|nr:N-acetylmuramoyl-L-alanine amidase [Clostridia bacterium]
MSGQRSSSFIIKLIILFIAFIACAVGLLYAAKYLGVRKDLPIDAKPVRTYVVDAGHGGPDGGAVGVTGAIEKDIDLAVSKKLASLLSLCGKRVVMTRTGDDMLSLPGTTGNRKGRDIRSRIKIADGTPGALLVSIHVNSFPQEKYRGMQIFYSPSDAVSQQTAEAVRTSCVTYLQPENDRKTKPAASAIYLLNNVSSPAILIECGFISNAEEEKLLCDGGYQTRLGAVICAGLTAPSE